MNVSLANQAYEPEELTALKATFDEITTQRWFRPTEEAKKGFAKFLLTTYPACQFNRQRDFEKAEAVARQCFSRDYAVAH